MGHQRASTPLQFLATNPNTVLVPIVSLSGLVTKQTGSISRVGIFLDFVWLTTRTMHPHGGASYVRGARRTRIDRHEGGIERLGGRT